MSWEEDKIVVEQTRIGKRAIVSIEFCRTENSPFKWCCRVYDFQPDDKDGNGHYYRSYAECTAYRDGLLGRTKDVVFVQFEDAEDFGGEHGHGSDF